ncbi:MAG TPA: outer membrane beta-barrel protein [Vicinamibacterales bacterium]|nr:outer membrane beta-barrel protein [Vicinamibacterales bacterium]
MIRALIISLAIAVAAVPARAEAAEQGRFEIGIGPLWMGSASFGARPADETNAAGQAVPLFVTATTLDAATGVEGRFGLRLTERFDVEATGSYAGPHLVAKVTSDSEAGLGPFTSDEWVQQFTVGAALVWKLPPLRRRPRWMPFVAGGAQYVRQVHEGGTLLESGQLYEAGAGIKYELGSRSGARLKAIGVRGEGRAVVRAAGVNVDGRAHLSPALAASLYVRF